MNFFSISGAGHSSLPQRNGLPSASRAISQSFKFIWNMLRSVFFPEWSSNAPRTGRSIQRDQSRSRDECWQRRSERAAGCSVQQTSQQEAKREKPGTASSEQMCIEADWCCRCCRRWQFRLITLKWSDAVVARLARILHLASNKPEFLM